MHVHVHVRRVLVWYATIELLLRVIRITKRMSIIHVLLLLLLLLHWHHSTLKLWAIVAAEHWLLLDGRTSRWGSHINTLEESKITPLDLYFRNSSIKAMNNDI